MILQQDGQYKMSRRIPKSKAPIKPIMPTKGKGKKRGNPNHDKLGRFA